MNGVYPRIVDDDVDTKVVATADGEVDRTIDWTVVLRVLVARAGGTISIPRDEMLRALNSTDVLVEIPGGGLACRLALREP